MYTYNYIKTHKEWWLICIICSGVWGQEDLHEFKVNLDYMVTSRSAWVKTKQKKTKQNLNPTVASALEAAASCEQSNSISILGLGSVFTEEGHVPKLMMLLHCVCKVCHITGNVNEGQKLQAPVSTPHLLEGQWRSRFLGVQFPGLLHFVSHQVKSSAPRSVGCNGHPSCSADGVHKSQH